MAARKCSINGCDRNHRTKGYCSMHYLRFRRHGNPSERFWGKSKAFASKALNTETDNCILWPFSKGNGYPNMIVDGKCVTVTRWILQKATGESGEGLQASHKPVICHNPACINKRHLYWATVKQNNADKLLDGTQTFGQDHHTSKLSNRQVLAIIKDSRPCSQIARDYNVSASTIKSIVNRKTWTHLTDGQAIVERQVKQANPGKLSDEQVAAILSDNRTLAAITEDYPVSLYTIWRVKSLSKQAA